MMSNIIGQLMYNQWDQLHLFFFSSLRTVKCPTLTLYQGLRPAVWRERTHHCTVSAGNQTSTASWCKFTHTCFKYSIAVNGCPWCSCIVFFYLFLSLTVAVIIVMSGSMAIALTSQRRWRRQFGNGTAWDAEVMRETFVLLLSQHLRLLHIEYVRNYQKH